MIITEQAAQVLQQIDAALALAEKATKGPWDAGAEGDDMLYASAGGSDWIALAEINRRDAAFIAASRTLLPASLRCLKTAIEGLLEIYDATDGYDTADVVLTALLDQWEAAQ